MTDQLTRQVTSLQERLKDPRRQVDDYRLALDDYGDRMKMRLRQQVLNRADHLRHLRVRLGQTSPRMRNQRQRFILESLLKNMVAAMRQRMVESRQALKNDMSLLESFSPLAVLHRGYSITFRSQTGEVIREAGSVHEGEDVVILLAKGRLVASVKSRREEEPAALLDGRNKVQNRDGETNVFAPEPDLPKGS